MGTDFRAQVSDSNLAVLFNIRTPVSIEIVSIFFVLSVTNQLKNVSQ